MHASPDLDGQFSVQSVSESGTHTLTLTGELDIATADQLTEALDAITFSDGDSLVIDLTAVGFMDSTGLRVLIDANRRSASTPFDLVIVTGESPARRVLELTRMDEHMRVVETL